MKSDSVFNAQQNLTFSSDRMYRVYVVGRDLFFIRIGGQAGLVEGAAVHFGLIGGLILAWWSKKAAAKKEAMIQSFDQENPEELLSEHQHNFKLSHSEFESGVLEPPSVFGSHGPYAGRWKVTLWDGRTMHFQFRTDEDVQAALKLLPEIYGSALTVNVEWNEVKKRFQKITRPPLRG